MASAVYEYLYEVFWHWWGLVTVVLFLADKILEWSWPGYRTWLAGTFSLRTRRRMFWWALLVFVFVAGFFAWNDEHNKVAEKDAEIKRITGTLGTPVELGAIREALSSRQLTEQQQEQIANRLRVRSGTSCKVTYIGAAGGEGEENRLYAMQFVKIFGKAGWVGPSEPEGVGSVARGVFVYVTEADLVSLLESAFAEAGIRHIKVVKVNSEEKDKEQVTVLVASRPYLND